MTCSSGGISGPALAPELCGRTLFDLFTIRVYDTYAFAQILTLQTRWAVYPTESCAGLIRSFGPSLAPHKPERPWGWGDGSGSPVSCIRRSQHCETPAPGL